MLFQMPSQINQIYDVLFLIYFKCRNFKFHYGKPFRYEITFKM